MLLAVRVCEAWGAAEHGGAEDVDPCGEGHVERRWVEWRIGRLQRELANERAGGFKVLVPGDIWQAVIRTADTALEEDHAKGRL